MSLEFSLSRLEGVGLFQEYEDTPTRVKEMGVCRVFSLKSEGTVVMGTQVVGGGLTTECRRDLAEKTHGDVRRQTINVGYR